MFWTWIIPDCVLKNSSVEKHKNKICNEEVWLCFKRIATWAHIIPAAMILVLLISPLMINQELEKLRPAPLCKMPTVYSKGAGEFSVGGQAQALFYVASGIINLYQVLHKNRMMHTTSALWNIHLTMLLADSFILLDISSAAGPSKKFRNLNEHSSLYLTLHFVGVSWNLVTRLRWKCLMRP